jgi:hypothetical protein
VNTTLGGQDVLNFSFHDELFGREMAVFEVRGIEAHKPAPSGPT